MSNLAIAYDRQGKYNDAEVLWKQCLDKEKMVLGESHPHTLMTMNNLADTYCSQDRYNDAEDLFKQCLDKRKIVLGDNHPQTLTTINNLADTYKILDKHQEAEDLVKQRDSWMDEPLEQVTKLQPKKSKKGKR